jgi:hypothetical protein
LGGLGGAAGLQKHWSLGGRNPDMAYQIALAADAA